MFKSSASFNPSLILIYFSSKHVLTQGRDSPVIPAGGFFWRPLPEKTHAEVVHGRFV